MKPPLSRAQRSVILNGILWLVLLLVILQLWLLTATMNAFLGGDVTVVWPAALASLACFGLNLGLLFHLFALEKGDATLFEERALYRRRPGE
jgi:hypothetical protein